MEIDSAHYNQGRPHASLGPGIPDVAPDKLAQPNGHHIPAGHHAVATLRIPPIVISPSTPS